MKNVGSPPIGIIFDLAAILDLRLSAIGLAQPELIGAVSNSPDYYLRKDDQWHNVHPDLSNSMVSLRLQRSDLELIKKSRLTMVCRHGIDTINDIITRSKAGDPENNGIYIIINTHPFKLAEDVVASIAEAFTQQLGYPGIPVAHMDMELKGITPTFLMDNNIQHWYCYDYQNWLGSVLVDTSEEGAKITGCPNVKMYAPKLTADHSEIEKFVDELKEDVSFDEFAWTKVAFANFINFEFLPSAIFSKLDVDKLIKLEHGDTMERKEAVSVLFEATRDVSERHGAPQTVDMGKAAESIDKLKQMLDELGTFNTEKGVPYFRDRLANIALEMCRLYNHTPFNPADDLEAVIDALSLGVDTTDQAYAETEARYNAEGFKTIKREVTINGEVIYRCIALSSGYSPSLLRSVNENEILPSVKKRLPRFVAVDDIQLANYLREV